MSVNSITTINERYKKIIWDLDDIIISITNEIIKNEKVLLNYKNNMMHKNKKKKNCIFFDPNGYFICFSYLTKPYIKIEI
jgi:hypothetical protein